MTAPDKIFATVGYIGKHDTRVRGEFDTEPSEKAIPYVPITLAQAAVAAAYEAAAQVCDNGNAGAFWGKAIRALATPDQIAALAAVRVATVTVKPLVWSPFMNGYCLHTETRLAACSTAESIIGTYAIGRKHTYMKTTKPEERAFDDHLSSAWWVETPSRKLIGPFNSDVLAKAAAQADYDARIRSAITIASGASPNHITLPRAEVEALTEAARDFQMIRAVWTDPHNDNLMRKASMTLDALQERMK